MLRLISSGLCQLQKGTCRAISVGFLKQDGNLQIRGTGPNSICCKQFSGGNRFAYNPRRRTRNDFALTYNSELENVDWSSTELSPLTKSSYVPHPDITNRATEEVDSYKKQHKITVTGDNSLRPILSFEEANFSDHIIQSLKKQNFAKPTAIQAQSWPVALSGHNMVGICYTGSGKTLGYTLPAIEHCISRKSSMSRTGQIIQTHTPTVLVVAPTRELAKQVHSVVEEFSPPSLNSACVYGGVPDTWYNRFARTGLDICIATPGRLIALLLERKISLRECSYAVLDEADRLLDQGFQESIRCILNQCRPDRQILMWTATWTDEIQELADDYLKKHVRITIGSSALMANRNIRQHVEVCTEEEKNLKLKNTLDEIRKEDPSGKVIIFVNTIEMVNRVARSISYDRRKSFYLHGQMTQNARGNMLARFRGTNGGVLIATDVAARGLDVENVNYIINYDFPTTLAAYIHRIGRCGRADVMGKSYTFFTPLDFKHVRELIDQLKECDQEVNPELLSIANNRFSQRRSGSNRDWRSSSMSEGRNYGRRHQNPVFY